MSLLRPTLEAFVAVVRLGTVHQAASEMGLTQTGITQRIRSLERQLNTTLFTRSRKGMHPTEEGLALLQYCTVAKDLEGEAFSKIYGFGKEREVQIRLAGPYSITRFRVIPQCLSLRSEFPKLFFSFAIEDDGSQLHFLRTGKVHFAILPREQVTLEMDSKLLKKERYILVGPPAWKSRELKEILKNEIIVDFDENDQMTFVYLRKHRLFDLSRKVRHFANNTDAVADMVSRGLGYSVLTEDVALPLVEQGKLIHLNPSSVLYYEQALAWYPRPERSAYFDAVIRVIK